MLGQTKDNQIGGIVVSMLSMIVVRSRVLVLVKSNPQHYTKTYFNDPALYKSN